MTRGNLIYVRDPSEPSGYRSLPTVELFCVVCSTFVGVRLADDPPVERICVACQAVTE